MIIELTNEIILTSTVLITALVTWLTTYIVTKRKTFIDFKKVEVYANRSKVAIWFKWMFYLKLLLTVFIAIFLPEYIKLHYDTFLFDVFGLMYIHSYSKGDLKKLSSWWNRINAKGMINKQNGIKWWKRG